MRNDYLNKNFDDPEIRQHICYTILNDPICRDIIVKAIYSDLCKLDIEQSAARNWRKLISILGFILMLLLEEMMRNIHDIITRIKQWIF